MASASKQVVPVDRTGPLAEFVSWVKKNISGDEKGEAQIFLDRLFQAFGWLGLREAGAKCELRVKKSGGGTSFADLVFKPVVVIEMKKRGTNLSAHYRQAFDYWARLVPDRPRYAVLCNFDEFWVYDFETQMDVPVDIVRLADLPQRYRPLAFLFSKPEAPVFGNDQEAVTRQAADKLASCYNSMVKKGRGIERDLAQRFTRQVLMALFAEDIGLLPKYFFTRLLEECSSPVDAYDVIGGLFEAMNTRGGAQGGRFKGVDYFNGGLFAQPAHVELNEVEFELLRSAAKDDWSKVRPEIFGALFEHSLGKEERHAYGAHFTSAVDIMKIVGPTIVEPWTDAIERAGTLKELKTLLSRIETFKILDPACGSGNFLYVAYRELKRLEARIYGRMASEFKSVDAAQRPFGFVTARNFFGMDINPFAIELAKVTMMLAHKLAIDELHIRENALPPDNLDANFQAVDALIQPDGSRTPWPMVDVIIGNPPFLGAKHLKPERGAAYANAVRSTYPEVPGMADYCVYWIRRAHEALPACMPKDPLAGRAGLVGTQNIRNNASRVGGLDHVTSNGTIIEAVENQPWSGEANVNVSIVNWVKTLDASLLPDELRLWSKIEPAAGRLRARSGTGPASKHYELAFREVAFINSALSDQTDVSGAVALACNTNPQRCFNGQMLGHAAFLLTEQEREGIVKHDKKSADVIYPYLNGVDALTGEPLDRYVLDFEQRDQLEAAVYRGAFEWVRMRVRPDRQRKAAEGADEQGVPRTHHKAFLARWWQLSFGRPEMLSVIKPLPRYLACSYVTKRPIFIFVSSAIRPSNLIQVFGFADDYSFGILQSDAHWRWFTTKCGKLTERFRYSAESVFDTLPWPQAPSAAQVKAVAAAGREIRRIRAEALKSLPGGLRALYRTLENPGKNPLRDAHGVLNRAVLDAYGFSPKKDLLAQLLALNQAGAAALTRGKTFLGPGLPTSIIRRPADVVSEDCLKPSGL